MSLAERVKKFIARTGIMTDPAFSKHRVFNGILASLALLFLSPFFGVVALLIRRYDRGPVFRTDERVGKNGVLFDLYAFRTSTPAQDGEEEHVTPIGRFLRRTRLEHLPRLFNVVLGDMNIVGPRPQDPLYVEVFKDEYQSILSFRPGLTSPAALQFRNERELLCRKTFFRVYTEKILPRKLELELGYFPEQSIKGDMKLIAKTFVDLAMLVRG